jgi:ribA/ribD-fused uncharacterized protein
MKSNDTHTFFWSGVFSNWYPVIFKYKGNQFENTEQAFMWEKANYFGDSKIADTILQTPDPKENKGLGRRVKNFNSFKWDNICKDIMYDVNLEKFNQNPRLKKILLETEGKDLVEASPYDTIWGIGMDEDEAVGVTPNEWRGKNYLGEVLTKLRNDFLNGKAS